MPKVGGSYTEGLVGQPSHINPLLAPANAVDMDLSRLVYSGLYKFDENQNLAPDLAESNPAVSPDGKTYTVKIKDKIVEVIFELLIKRLSLIFDPIGR